LPYVSVHDVACLSWLVHGIEINGSIYSPYSYTGVDASPPPTADLANLEEVRDTGSGPRAIVSEVFLFEYGVTVIWGMTESEEKRFLKEITKFEVESLRISSLYPFFSFFTSLSTYPIPFLVSLHVSHSLVYGSLFPRVCVGIRFNGVWINVL
jgi:hypothetical protein